VTFLPNGSIIPLPDSFAGAPSRHCIADATIAGEAFAKSWKPASPDEFRQRRRAPIQTTGIDRDARFQGRRPAGMPVTGRESALDRWPARAVALLVAAGALAALGYIHRKDLFPTAAPPAAEARPDPFHDCMAQRGGDVDRLLQEGTIQKAQADLFRSRAEALCRAEANKALATAPGGPPAGPSPGLQSPARRF
jgi:hypothetical protein